MEIDKVSQISWRKFLNTDAGRKGLLLWRENVPSVHPGDSHAIIFQAGISEGWKKALDHLTFIIGGEPEKPVNADSDQLAMEK